MKKRDMEVKLGGGGLKGSQAVPARSSDRVGLREDKALGK
jgi:hypothetical protein